jgi:PAS domain S-box-containing protein
MPSSDSFDRRRFELLERIARGAPVYDVLDGIVRLIEEQGTGVLGSILLVDREHGVVRRGAAPSLPAIYTRLLEGQPIGPRAGSCGTAAYLGERVIVEDIATHPYWTDYAPIALSHGLRACWSTPIKSPEGDVLGTFAMYYREIRGPRPEEIAWVDAATDLASIAIVRDRTLRSLQESEARATHMARLYAVASGVGDALVRIRDAQRLYELACRIPVEQGFARLAWIGLLDEERRVTPVARFGADDGYVDRVVRNLRGTPRHRGPAARAAVTGEPTTSNDIESDPDFRFREEALARGLRSCAVLPLRLRGAVTGLLSLYADRAGVFGPDELSVLRTLADDVSFAVESLIGEGERRRLLYDLGERVKELTLLHRTARLLQTSRPLDGALAAELVARIPAAWQYPDLLEARIAWRDVEATTPGWTQTPWLLAAGFEVGEDEGVVEVAYRQAPSDAEPFLREERELLQSLADMLAAHLRREASEAALRESEDRLRAIVEHTPNVAIQSYDADARLRFANRASLALYGWAPGEAIGRTLDELNFTRQEADRFAEAIARVAVSGAAIGPTDFGFRKPDGSEGVVLSTIFPVPVAGGDTAYVRMDVDLTDHRRMEEFAQASETLRSVIFRSVADVIFYISVEPDGGFRFLSVNPAFLRATGLDEDQIVGRSVDEVVPEPSRTLVVERYRRAIAERRSVQWEEVSDYPSGRRHGDVTIVPLFDDDGRCTHLLGTVHDLTERVRAEQERRDLESRLHQAQRLQSLGTFAGGIAHDFNNILTAIGGHANLAAMELASHPEALESLDEIRAATRRASALVRQILTFSRHEEPQRQLISLEGVVHEALGLLRATLPATVRVRARVESSTPLVLADATQVHQVLMNLGANAAHAMVRRGSLVDVTVQRVVIGEERAAPVPSSGREPSELAGEVPALPPGAYACITFIDDGAGMDETTRARVFEPFFTTRASGEGTGLGLSVVHGILQSHGGAVTVDSVPGRGTAFRLYFPAAESEATPIESPPAIPSDLSDEGAADERGAGEHIVYVDDEEALVHLATRTLTRLGYRVTGYASAPDALEAIRANPAGFDALVTDLAMPGKSGADLAREVLAMRPDLPIVILSGRVRPEDAAVARSLGVDVLLKPYSAIELARALRRRMAPQGRGSEA